MTAKRLRFFALLAISLVFTLLAAFFVVPAFLGPPKTRPAPPPNDYAI